MTTVLETAPERSLEQRMAALARGNDIRIKRSRLKKDVKAGREKLSAYLDEPPAWLETAKLRDLLLSMPGYGPVRADKLLLRVGAAPSKTMGGLTDRQRLAVLAAVIARGC